jgi:uncharacterized protein (TIRG00374 family)
MSETPSRTRRWLRVGVRVAVSVAVLIWLWRTVDVRQMTALILRVSPSLLLASLAAYICDESLATWKWQRLLVGVGVTSAFWPLFRLTLEGRFIAFFLPSTVTADLYKGAVLTRGGETSAAAASSILLERILGLLSVVTIGLVAIGTLPSTLLGMNSSMAVVAAVGATLAGLAVFLHADRIASHLIPRLPVRWAGIRRILHDLTAAFAVYRGRKGLLVQAFLTSLLIQGARAVAVWVLARAVGDGTPFIYFVLLVPYVYLVNLLPIASSRLGLEQAVFVGLFAAVGMPRETALAISLLSVAVGLVLVLPFGLSLLFKR